MRRFFAALARLSRNIRIVIPVLLRDVIGLAALACVIYGVWQIYRPAAWIIGGLLALLGVAGSSRAAGHRPPGS